MTQSEENRPSERETAQRLAAFFHRNGYVRRQNPQRFEEEGSSRYKKGDEIRLIAKSEDELNEIRRLLHKAGFKAGRPFQKVGQICQPVYGRKAVARFLKLVNEYKPETDQ